MGKKERPEGEKTKKVKKAMKAANSVLNVKLAKKPAVPVYTKTLEKLSKIDHSLKVWVGGLPKTATWKELEKHFTEVAGKPKLTEIMGKGTACVAYKTEDEAASAIAALNGTELGGRTIEVDVWTQKEKKERPGGEKPKKVKKAMKTVNSVLNVKLAK